MNYEVVIFEILAWFIDNEIIPNEMGTLTFLSGLSGMSIKWGDNANVIIINIEGKGYCHKNTAFFPVTNKKKLLKFLDEINSSDDN